jgi:hypothetical protein
VKLPRTIRLDASDEFVFERAAASGEWAVSGAFLFADPDPAALEGKARAAFRAGLLGVASFGWSTLAVVSEASDAERDQATETLAAQLRDRLGAPSRDAALDAAREEIAFAASLCSHPVNTLIAVHRTIEDGALRERFRTLTPRADLAAADRRYGPVFRLVETDEDEPAESVDLAGLARRDER